LMNRALARLPRPIPLEPPRSTLHEMQFDRARLAEVATGSVTHGGGHATARICGDEDAFVCEIGDAGVIRRMRTAGGVR
jgi:hypothetical protein